MEPERILVFGAGGHAKVVAEIARALGRDVIAFLEDGEAREGDPYFGSVIVSWRRFAADSARWGMLPIALAIGDNAARARALERLHELPRPVATLIHLSAVISPTAVIGEGTVVMPNAVVNADAMLGLGVIVNTGAVVEHDVQLGDFVHLSPNVALGGGVRVGARSHLGLGAMALPRVRIGVNVRVGAGAVVLSDVPDGATVVGVPARPIRASTPS
jgi:sugar O-acyltransferase (sialic acid O-acetyltransferase NeuD family)